MHGLIHQCRCPYGSGRAVEDREEAVAERSHFAAMILVDRRADARVLVLRPGADGDQVVGQQFVRAGAEGLAGDQFLGQRPPLRSGRPQRHGGEVVTLPYSSYAKMLAWPYMRKWFIEGDYLDALTTGAHPVICTETILGLPPPIHPRRSISPNAFHMPMRPTPPPVG